MKTQPAVTITPTEQVSLYQHILVALDSSDHANAGMAITVEVAGLTEVTTSLNQNNILGTAQYSAPEYFIGEAGTTRSDMYSLGVVAYQMLSGKLPYGAHVARATTRAAQRKLNYQSAVMDNRLFPMSN